MLIDPDEAEALYGWISNECLDSSVFLEPLESGRYGVLRIRINCTELNVCT